MTTTHVFLYFPSGESIRFDNVTVTLLTNESLEFYRLTPEGHTTQHILRYHFFVKTLAGYAIHDVQDTGGIS